MQVVARPPFDALDGLVDAELGVDSQEHVHVVGHDLHLNHVEALLGSHFLGDLLEALIDARHKDLPAAFKTASSSATCT